MSRMTQKFLVWVKEISPLLKLRKHGGKRALGTYCDFVLDVVNLKCIWYNQARKSAGQLETTVKFRKEVRAEGLQVTPVAIAV